MRPRPRSWVLASAVLLVLSGARTDAAAQVAGGCPAPALPTAPERPTDTTERLPSVAPGMRNGDAPDVLLLASLEARAVRFNSQPRVSVRFCWGDGAGDTLRVIERTNLPRPVVSGVTYRDVYVAVELRANLNAVCLLRDLGLTVSRDSTSSEVEREIQRRSGVCKRAD